MDRALEAQAQALSNRRALSNNRDKALEMAKRRGRALGPQRIARALKTNPLANPAQRVALHNLLQMDPRVVLRSCNKRLMRHRKSLKKKRAPHNRKTGSNNQDRAVRVRGPSRNRRRNKKGLKQALNLNPDAILSKRPRKRMEKETLNPANRDRLNRRRPLKARRSRIAKELAKAASRRMAKLKKRERRTATQRESAKG
jgi:hypothetical protein